MFLQAGQPRGLHWSPVGLLAAEKCAAVEGLSAPVSKVSFRRAGLAASQTSSSNPRWDLLEFRPLDQQTCNIDRELVFPSLAKFAMLRYADATCQQCPDSKHADSSNLKMG